MIEGWICPKCGAVYAPIIVECWRCAPLATQTGTGTEQLFTGGVAIIEDPSRTETAGGK